MRIEIKAGDDNNVVLSNAPLQYTLCNSLNRNKTKTILIANVHVFQGKCLTSYPKFHTVSTQIQCEIWGEINTKYSRG